MINNTTPGKWDRISAKSLDQQFLAEMIQGLGCSRFEAEAIVEKVHEIYDPLLEESDQQPGRMNLVVVAAGVRPNMPLREAPQKMVRLTVHGGASDVDVRRTGGVPALRQARLVRVTEEAFQQEGLLTLEDLSLLFNCGVRTLVEDLKALREQGVIPPLRSTVEDMGRAVTHRALIIRRWLAGEEYTDIARACHHRVESVARYVDKFKRCYALLSAGMDPSAAALVINLSLSLVEEFQHLAEELPAAPHRREELDRFVKKSRPFPMEVSP